jgi:SAM-dependent methyltransferase
VTVKLTRAEAASYWKDIHRTHVDSRQAVCHPNKPPMVNAFFDVAHRYGVMRALRAVGISLDGASVLDVGCGRGRWLALFEAEGANVTGIDISEDAVRHCRSRGWTAHVGSLDHLPDDDATLDLVTSVTVMLHLDPEAQELAAAEMMRVCRPGGFILLLEPTTYDTAPHVWARSVDEWAALFGGCDAVLIENHRFALPLRLLWRSPAMRLPPRLVTILETLAVGYALPVEALLMHWFRGRRGRLGLQHLMVFRKRP